MDDSTLAFLRMATITVLLGAIAILGLILLLIPDQTQRMFGPLAIIGVDFVAWILIHRGNPRGGIMVLTWGIWAAVTGISMFNGGVLAPAYFVYPLIIIFAGWLIGLRAAIAIAICSTIAGLGFAIADFLKVLPIQPPTSPFLYWVVQTTIFSVAASTIIYLLRSHQRQVEEVRTLTAKLARESANAATAEILRSSQELLDRTGRLARVGGWEIEVATGHLTWTAETFRIHDLEPAGTPPIEQAVSFYAPDARATVERAVKNAAEHGIGFEFELQLDTAKGRRIWVRSKGEPQIEDGKVVRVTGALQDITEQHQAAQALETSLNNLQRTLEATNEGILGYDGNDPSGKLLFSNNRLFEIWNIPLEDAPTTGRAEILAASLKFLRDPEKENERISEIRSLATLYEDKVYLNDGRVLFRRSIPLLEGSQISHVWSFRDITVEEKASDALKASRDEAQRASAAKSEFLSRMSHELRTPMHAIMGMVSLAKKRMSDPRGLDQLSKAKSAADHLLNLINDILDISRIEAGRMTLEKLNFTLRDVMDNVTNLTGEKAREKGLTLAIDLPPNIAERPLQGDTLRLSQILLNLTGNAVKFTNKGRIEIRVEQIEETEKEVLLRFEIRDSGIGIDAEAQQRLFVTFEQADGSMTRKYGGSGLGLSICKHLVRMMQGEIGVDSIPDQGSTFWFTVRLSQAAEGALPHASTRPTKTTKLELQRGFIGARILLADDEPISQEVSNTFLLGLGLNVDLANDGAEALSMAQAKLYDLIFMDVRMPNMNGLDAARAIRADSRNQITPIVAMTANAFEEDRKLCLDAGMDDHIGKPTVPQQLLEKLHMWLARSRESRGRT